MLSIDRQKKHAAPDEIEPNMQTKVSMIQNRYRFSKEKIFLIFFTILVILFLLRDFTHETEGISGIGKWIFSSFSVNFRFCISFPLLLFLRGYDIMYAVDDIIEQKIRKDDKNEDSSEKEFYAHRTPYNGFSKTHKCHF